MSDKSKTLSCPKCNGTDTCQISYGFDKVYI